MAGPSLAEISALPPRLDHPVDFAVGPDGSFFVLESDQEAGCARVRVFSSSGELLRTIGSHEEKPGVKSAGLLAPKAIEVGGDGQIFVTTKLWGAVSVRKFDPMGAPYLADGEGYKGAVKQFGPDGRLVRTHEFKTCPFELVVRKGTLFVGESYGTWSFDCRTGKALTNWASKAAKAFTVNGQGELMLFKFGSVQVVSPAGEQLRKIALSSPSRMKRASCVLADGRSIIVSCPSLKSVYRFDLDGSLDRALSGGRVLTKLYLRETVLYALDPENGEILRVTPDKR